MRQLSERHMEKIAKIRKKALNNLKDAEHKSSSSKEAVQSLVNFYEEQNFKVVKMNLKGLYEVYRVSNNVMAFDIRHCISNGKLTLGKKICIELEAKEDDLETLANIKKEPYRYENIRKIEDSTVFTVKGYDWSKLDKWEKGEK